MDDRENKKQGLIKSLEQIDSLMNLFESSVKKEHVKVLDSRDFSSVADMVYPDKHEDEAQTSDCRFDMNFEKLTDCALKCERCGLCKTRTNVVFGEGCIQQPKVMVIGEGPGENEDLTGRPFVGAAGQFLDRWLAAVSLSRTSNCYIANIVKCRPPHNRDPLDEEKQACLPFLKQQIELIKPKAILCLGRPASSLISGLEGASMGSMRGRLYFYNGSIPVFCIYHPAAVLRDQTLKASVWEDLKKMASFLNLEIAGARK